MRELPLPARALMVVAAVLAVALAAVAIINGHRSPSPWWLIALAAGITAGEALHVNLPFRRAGTAQFNLSDAALTIGLLLLPSAEVVLAACLGKLAWQLLDRVPQLKLGFNLAWYVSGTSLAALVVHAIAPRPGAVDVTAMLAVALGLATLTAVNAIAVGGIIALSGRQSWLGTVGTLTPPLALLAVSNVGPGLLAVLLAQTHPWALVALAVPVTLLYASSRQQVRAVIDRERSTALVTTEHRLSDARSRQEVAATLAQGVATILGLQAAVWLDGHWLTTPPPADPAAPGAIAAGSSCVPLGTGDGLLVAWAGELRVTRDASVWLERLARSGRVHLERAAAHSALEQERATLRAIVSGTGDGIYVLDDVGTVRLWNPAMARLAGRDHANALRLPASAVLGPGPWAEPGVHDVERSEDQTWRVSVATVHDGARRGLHVGVVHDVSAERRVARMKDDMLAVVSHELRTPLTPIKASAQLLRLRGDVLPQEHKNELLEQIEGRADHLTRLVEDLLLVGQMSTGARKDAAALSFKTTNVSPVQVDIAAVLRADVTQHALARPDHRLVYEGVRSQTAVTDPLRLRQVVDNLVDNACKFSPAGSQVRVRLDVDAAYATLSVRDQGRGISPQDLDRIFEPFERAEDPLVMSTSGAGLGLSIVRSLVTALGGDLHVDSTPGQGTTMAVRLPLRHPAASQDRQVVA